MMYVMQNHESPLMRKEEALMLQANANALKYKSVIELRDGKKLAWREVAERMGYSQSYTQRIYHKAKAILGDTEKTLRLKNPIKNIKKRAEIAAASNPLIRQEQASRIRNRIREEKYHAVITLRDEDHLTFKEIGERLGYTKSYTVGMYHKAKRVAEQSETVTE